MRTTIIAAILVLAATAAAFLQFSAAMQLRAELAQSEAARAALEAQLAESLVQTSQFQEQINTLQSNLQSSSAQLALLSESLQEARQLIQGQAPVVEAPAQ